MICPAAVWHSRVHAVTRDDPPVIKHHNARWPLHDSFRSIEEALLKTETDAVHQFEFDAGIIFLGTDERGRNRENHVRCLANVVIHFCPRTLCTCNLFTRDFTLSLVFPLHESAQILTCQPQVPSTQPRSVRHASRTLRRSGYRTRTVVCGRDWRKPCHLISSRRKPAGRWKWVLTCVICIPL